MESQSVYITPWVHQSYTQCLPINSLPALDYAVGEERADLEKSCRQSLCGSHTWKEVSKRLALLLFPWFDTTMGGGVSTISNPQFDEVLLYSVPERIAKSSSTSFTGSPPSSLAGKSGLWECRLCDQNCIKDYFGLRMSLISQVLTVVCRLEDLKFPIISHTSQEKTDFWKAHVKNLECRCLRTFLTISGLAIFLSMECSKRVKKSLCLYHTSQTTQASGVLFKLIPVYKEERAADAGPTSQGRKLSSAD